MTLKARPVEAHPLLISSTAMENDKVSRPEPPYSEGTITPHRPNSDSILNCKFTKTCPSRTLWVVKWTLADLFLGHVNIILSYPKCLLVIFYSKIGEFFYILKSLT